MQYASSQKENISKIYMKNVIREGDWLFSAIVLYIQYSGQWDKIMRVSLLTRENIEGWPLLTVEAEANGGSKS
jgi:hypothetical protein